MKREDEKMTERVLFSVGSLVEAVERDVCFVTADGLMLGSAIRVEFLLAGTDGREVTRDEPVPDGARVMVPVAGFVTVGLPVGGVPAEVFFVVGEAFFDVGAFEAALEDFFPVGLGTPLTDDLVIPGFTDDAIVGFAEGAAVCIAFSGPIARQVE